MGINSSGDADVGVADEFDALFQEKHRGRMPQVVEADLPEVCRAEERVEVPGEGDMLDGVAAGPA